MEQTQVESVIIERLENLKNDNLKEHKAILDQTTRTNGLVADIQKWRFMMTGAFILLNVFVVPIIIAVVINYILKRNI